MDLTSFHLLPLAVIVLFFGAGVARLIYVKRK